VLVHRRTQCTFCCGERFVYIVFLEGRRVIPEPMDPLPLVGERCYAPYGRLRVPDAPRGGRFFRDTRRRALPRTYLEVVVLGSLRP
jgi:hypothetical protein